MKALFKILSGAIIDECTDFTMVGFFSMSIRL